MSPGSFPIILTLVLQLVGHIQGQGKTIIILCSSVVTASTCKCKLAWRRHVSKGADCMVLLVAGELKLPNYFEWQLVKTFCEQTWTQCTMHKKLTPLDVFCSHCKESSQHPLELRIYTGPGAIYKCHFHIIQYILFLT
jgi:hypothetical protein